MTTITQNSVPTTSRRAVRDEMIALVLMTAVLAIVPLTGVYPFFVMQGLCFALLACAFNLLIGYGGLLSFGHAMFLGTAGYVSGHALKVWGLPPELAIIVGTAATLNAHGVTDIQTTAQAAEEKGNTIITFANLYEETEKGRGGRTARHERRV